MCEVTSLDIRKIYFLQNNAKNLKFYFRLFLENFLKNSKRELLNGIILTRFIENRLKEPNALRHLNIYSNI